MKLRIKGDSIRLRLQQAEVNRLHEQGFVEESLHLGPDPGDEFIYRLEAGAGCEPALLGGGRGITVRIPAEWAAELASTERIGFDHKIRPARDIEVRLLIEKDFKCLVVRPDEDDSGGYDHPGGGPCSPPDVSSQ